MAETTFTFRVDKALKARFAKAAKARDRAGSQLLRDFMRDFIAGSADASDHDAWFRRQVQAGLDSAESGQLLPAEEVEAEFSARRARSRSRASGAA